jgi:hypothetical protein
MRVTRRGIPRTPSPQRYYRDGTPEVAFEPLDFIHSRQPRRGFRQDGAIAWRQAMNAGVNIRSPETGAKRALSNPARTETSKREPLNGRAAAKPSEASE